MVAKSEKENAAKGRNMTLSFANCKTIEGNCAVISQHCFTGVGRIYTQKHMSIFSEMKEKKLSAYI